MNNILDFKEFKSLNERSSTNTTKNNKLIIIDIINIIDDMFEESKNKLFFVDGEYKKESELTTTDIPTSVKFEPNKQDYKLSYDSLLNNDYEGQVLAKRDVDVSLKFKDKSEENGKYNIEFKIILDDITDDKISKTTKKSDEQDDADTKDTEKLGDAF